MIVKVLCQFPAGNLRYATSNCLDGNGNWPGKVTSISPISRSIGPDRTYETSSVTIDFDDTDRFFKSMMSGSNRFIAGKTVELYTETDDIVYKGTVETWGFAPASFVITVSDKNAGLAKIITQAIARSDFPDCSDEAEGQTIPIIYGNVYQDNGAITAYRVERWKYIVSAHECYSIESVFDPDGVQIDENDYIEGVEADGFHYITYVPVGEEPNTLRVNVKGKKNQADYISTPYEAAVDILTSNQINYDTDSLLYTFSIFDLRGYNIAAVFSEETSVQDFFQLFCISFDCDYYISKDMKFKISILDPWNLSPAKRFQPSEVNVGKISTNPEGVVQKIRYNYSWSPADKDYRRKPYFSQENNWPEVKTEALSLRYISLEGNAFDVVQRYALQKKDPPPSIPIEIALKDFIEIDIGDLIEVDSPDFVTTPRTLKILRAEIDAGLDIVELDCEDVVGLAGELCILGKDGMTPDYIEATENEKRYTYLCDQATGQFSDGTPGKVLY